MNKKLILGLVIAMLVVIPGALAVDRYYEAFDLFGLFVENIFGNIGMAWLGVGAIIFGLGMVSRMSMELVTTILIFFTISFAWSSFGELVSIVILIGLLLYAINAGFDVINASRI